MTLDEAILHSEEKAEQLCGKCAEEHAQLAEWLKELKIRRETIEAEPVRHGRWIKITEFCGISVLKCSRCGIEHPRNATDFCPDCGAKMDEKEH